MNTAIFPSEGAVHYDQPLVSNPNATSPNAWVTSGHTVPTQFKFQNYQDDGRVDEFQTLSFYTPGGSGVLPDQILTALIENLSGILSVTNGPATVFEGILSHLQGAQQLMENLPAVE